MSKFKSEKNKFILNGNNGKSALKFLNDITDILDKFNIKYWLDYGTLIGIMREERLLPWDDDIDISIFEEDCELMVNKVLPEIQKIFCCIQTRHLKEDLYPLKKDTINVFKVRNKKFKFFRGNVRLDIAVMYKHEENIYSVSFDKLHRLPQKLLREFDLIEFNGKSHRIPKEYDAYLTYCYGNWKTIDKSYNSDTDHTRTLVT